MRSIECDQDGNPRVYYAVGVDPTEPNKVVPVIHEIRPGGMIVVKPIPDRRVTVAPDPTPPPSLEEVERERMDRAAETAERERQAIATERGEPANSTAAADDTEDEEEAAERAAREAAARRAETTTKTRPRAARSR